MYIDTTNAAAGRIVLNAEKADKDVNGREIHRFYESLISQGTVIPSSTNLNSINFLQVGSYSCATDAVSASLTNCPTNEAFVMRVYSPMSTAVDNEATGTNIYRLRHIITRSGQEYFQAANSGSSASNFTYGKWNSNLNSTGTLTLTGDVAGSVSLSNGMTLTADITASGVTAGEYGPTANSTPAHGASFQVPEFTVAADGRITAATTRTITLPADNNTTYGLSAESGHIIQLKDNNNGITKVTLVQGNDMVLTTDTANDKITIAHEAFTTTKASNNTTAAPSHGGTFDVLDSVTTDNGHITGYTVKTVTLPADNNATYTFNNNNTNTLTLTGAGGGATTSVELKAGTQTSLTPGDKIITINHGTVSTTPDTGTAAPSHGETFKAIDAITTDNGHITGYTTKTITLPTDNNTTYTIKAANNVITLDGSTGTDTNVTLAAGNDIGISTGASDNKITIKHSDFTTSSTTSTATDGSPSHGGSFNVIDGITTDNGHITGYTVKSVNLPSDNNITSALSAEYNSTDEKHQIRLTESNGTTYNIELVPGSDITLSTDTANDKITINHEAFTTTPDTNTASPAHGGTFDAIDSITIDNGHVTGYRTKTVTLPIDNNTTYSLSAETGNKVTLTGSNNTTTSVTFNNGKNIGITQSGNNLTITHDTFTTAEGTKTTAAPAHGATFDVLDSITTSNGHVTGFVKKTVTLPADNNTDTKVTQTAKSDNVNYPLLGAYAASPTSGTAADVVYDTGMHMNPSTNTITATTFAGNATSASTAAACSGNAATATKLATARTISLTGDVTGSGSFDGSGNLSITATVADNSHNHSYLPLAGGTMTGPISFNANGACQIRNGGNDVSPTVGGALGNIVIDSWYGISFTTTCSSTYQNKTAIGFDCRNGIIRAAQVYGAVWNDYAEFRDQKEEIKPGYCVASTDNGQVYKTTEKFQACDGIVSDTFGFAIGETENCKTPLAVAGRVLAYCEGSKYDYHAGDTVCAGPGGKVVKMTREEIREWPDRIIGIVSEIPEYETWGSGNVAVNDRIWIKVK